MESIHLHPSRRFVLRSLAALTTVVIAAAVATPAQAQPDGPWPTRPITWVVPFTPGGSTDVIGRTIGQKLADVLKQPVVVDNKPGAAGAVGAAFVAKSKPDGYTLFGGTISTHAINASLYKNLAYDPVKDFEPIALLGSFPLVVTVPASLPVKNFAELVQYSKTSKDGKLDHGTPTTSFVLVAETLTSTAGVKFNHILYRGSGPVVAGLLGGEIQVGVLDSPAVVAQVKAGKLKALAVTTGKRSAALPDVPTVAESGFAGYDIPIWTALMAPKGTPEPVLARLRTAVAEILQEKDTVDKLHAQGMDPGNADAQALARRIEGDIARWSGVARAANIKPE